jgi:MFS family permease
MSVGLAIGYMYSSIVANSIGWQWAFFVEAAILMPLLLFLYSVAPRFPHVKPGVKHFASNSLLSSTEDDVVVPLNGNEESDNKDGEEGNEVAFSRSISVGSNSGINLTLPGIVDEVDHPEKRPPNLRDELNIIFRIPVYVNICLGYAAQSATLIGLSTFGSAFLMGMGFFDSEVSASIIFGGLVSVAGMLGFPIGGMILDHLSAKSKEKNGHVDHNSDLVNSTALMFASSVIGVFLFCISTIFHTQYIFLLILFFGCLFLFVCMSAINLGIILSVPAINQSTAIAFSSIILHVMGDVPSPLIVGFMKDELAPGCTGDDDNINTSDNCRDDGEGLRLTFLIVSLWLCWCVLFFGIAWAYALRKKYSSSNQYATVDVKQKF